MARYQIKESESAELLQAFADCQAGQCSCPTDEYQKLDRMDIEQSAGKIRLRLEPKPGEKLDPTEIAACLDYTTAVANEAES